MCGGGVRECKDRERERGREGGGYVKRGRSVIVYV